MNGYGRITEELKVIRQRLVVLEPTVDALGRRLSQVGPPNTDSGLRSRGTRVPSRGRESQAHTFKRRRARVKVQQIRMMAPSSRAKELRLDHFLATETLGNAYLG